MRNVLGRLNIGMSDPIDAARFELSGGGPQRAELASGASFGHGNAICENDETMHILPGSSDDAVHINPVSALGNMWSITSLKTECAPKRDDFSSDHYLALVFYLSMISAHAFGVCRAGKPGSTFPDRASVRLR
jgi:hypothetical protein